MTLRLLYLHINGEPAVCVTKALDASGKSITTIEAFPDGGHPVQGVGSARCAAVRYCQAGQMMTACALLRKSRTRPMPKSTRNERQTCAVRHYIRIRAAVHHAAQLSVSRPAASGVRSQE